MAETVRSTRIGALARITLARPPLNVLTTEMLRELSQELRSAAADPDVRLVRLDAEGKVFCAGVDVGDHMGDALEPMMDGLTDLFDAFAEVPVPTVSIVHGAALGGGCELVLGTDLCLASEAAKFGQPEIRLGVFAPPASVLLPRIVGERRALGLLLTGQAVAAREAREVGLVNEVFSAEGFEAAVDDWLMRLLELSGPALRLAKRAVRIARDLPEADAHRRLQRLYLDELMRTHDANEGLRAFMDKRSPEWQHR